jgi:hypothetical protein
MLACVLRSCEWNVGQVDVGCRFVCFFSSPSTYFMLQQKMLLLLPLLFALLSLSSGKPVSLSKGQKATLPSCGGCFTGVNGIDYACCNDMSIYNGVCTCDGNTPCTQCSPDLTKDKEKVLTPSFLPSCGGCYSGINNVDYTCADCSISITNGYCVCGDGSSCTQCSSSAKDKIITSLAHPKNDSSLPSCNGCFSAISGVDYECCNDMVIKNGVCKCEGGILCSQCSPERGDVKKHDHVIHVLEQDPIQLANGQFVCEWGAQDFTVGAGYYFCCNSIQGLSYAAINMTYQCVGGADGSAEAGITGNFGTNCWDGYEKQQQQNINDNFVHTFLTTVYPQNYNTVRVLTKFYNAGWFSSMQVELKAVVVIQYTTSK